jgi:hypothetical protein
MLAIGNRCCCDTVSSGAVVNVGMKGRWWMRRRDNSFFQDAEVFLGGGATRGGSQLNPLQVWQFILILWLGIRSKKEVSEAVKAVRCMRQKELFYILFFQRADPFSEACV